MCVCYMVCSNIINCIRHLLKIYDRSTIDYRKIQIKWPYMLGNNLSYLCFSFSYEKLIQTLSMGNWTQLGNSVSFAESNYAMSVFAHLEEQTPVTNIIGLRELARQLLFSWSQKNRTSCHLWLIYPVKRLHTRFENCQPACPLCQHLC